MLDLDRLTGGDELGERTAAHVGRAEDQHGAPRPRPPRRDLGEVDVRFQKPAEIPEALALTGRHELRHRLHDR